MGILKKGQSQKFLCVRSGKNRNTNYKTYFLPQGKHGIRRPSSSPFQNNIETKVPVFILAGSTSGVHVGWGEAKVPFDHERIHFGSDMLLQAAKQGYLGVGIEQAGG